MRSIDNRESKLLAVQIGFVSQEPMCDRYTRTPKLKLGSFRKNTKRIVPNSELKLGSFRKNTERILPDSGLKLSSFRRMPYCTLQHCGLAASSNWVRFAKPVLIFPNVGSRGQVQIGSASQEGKLGVQVPKSLALKPGPFFSLALFRKNHVALHRDWWPGTANGRNLEPGPGNLKPWRSCK